MAEAIVTIAPMRADDWRDVAVIFAEGIATGSATFEMAIPSWSAFDASRLSHPRLVARSDREIVGWIAASLVSRRTVYRGVVEHSIYVSERARGRGVGRVLLDAFIEQSEAAGIWTIQSSLFPENAASLALHRACGFRVVGTRERIAQRDGRWRDTVLVERRAAGDPS